MLDLKDLWSVLYVLDTPEFESYSKFEKEYGCLSTFEEVNDILFLFMIIFLIFVFNRSKS